MEVSNKNNLSVPKAAVLGGSAGALAGAGYLLKGTVKDEFKKSMAAQYQTCEAHKSALQQCADAVEALKEKVNLKQVFAKGRTSEKIVSGAKPTDAFLDTMRNSANSNPINALSEEHFDSLRNGGGIKFLKDIIDGKIENPIPDMKLDDMKAMVHGSNIDLAENTRAIVSNMLLSDTLKAGDDVMAQLTQQSAQLNELAQNVPDSPSKFKGVKDALLNTKDKAINYLKTADKKQIAKKAAKAGAFAAIGAAVLGFGALLINKIKGNKE